MITYITYAIVILLGWTCSSLEQTDALKKKFLFFSNALLGITAGFRYTPRYADYMNIRAGLNRIRSLSFSDILYDLNSAIGDNFLRKIVTLISDSNQLYFLVAALLVATAVSVFIYRHSENVYLSEIIYLSLGFYSISLNIVRQFIAISICLFAFSFLRKRRIILYTIFVVLASLFHSSAMIMLPAYFLVSMKVSDNDLNEILKFVLYFVVCSLFVSFGVDNQYAVYNEELNPDGYGMQNANVWGIVVPSLTVAALFFLRMKIISVNSESQILINLCYLSLPFYVLSVTGSLIIQRVALYFSIYNIIAVVDLFKYGLHKDDGKFFAVVLVLYYVVWSCTGRFAGFSQLTF